MVKERVKKKKSGRSNWLKLILELIENFSSGSLEFRNLTTGYYALASQKMALVVSMDSLNHSLKETLFNSINN